jgi:hypothetical protein
MEPMRAHHLPAVLLSLSLASCLGPAMSAAPGAAPPPGKPSGNPPQSAAPQGKPAAEALPPLDHSPLLRAKMATFMTPNEPVFAVKMGEDARAFPLRILDWHAVSNDTINFIPTALAYCRPCGSVVLYRTDTPKGTLTLAASGRYRDGDQLLVDRQTGTLWKQLTGTPVEGPLAGSGIVLQPLPVVLTTWSSWFQDHPETRVLSLDTGFQRDYKPGARPADDPPVTVSHPNPALPESSPVYGVVVGGAARAYPVDRVAKQGVIDDELGGRAIVIVADPGADPKSRTIRVYERGDRAFIRSGHAFLGANFVNDENGHPWKIDEESLVATDGKKVPRLPGRLTNWAGWAAAYPQAGIYGEAKAP